MLNQFFGSVFTEEGDGPIPQFGPIDVTQLNEIHVTEEDITKKLKSLNITKSPGPDNVHPRVLKELAEELATPLKLLLDKTLKERKIPDKWKEAEVRPIFKKGNKNCPGNYRPVSLTSVICKVLEGFIRDGLYEHLVNNNILAIEQFGFCKGRSCATQLLVTIDDWMRNLDENTPLDAIYLDFRKAFDTVPHRRLIEQLKGNGVSGDVLGWIQDFLEKKNPVCGC